MSRSCRGPRGPAVARQVSPRSPYRCVLAPAALNDAPPPAAASKTHRLLPHRRRAPRSRRLAGPVVRPGRFAQGEIRIAHVYCKTGPLEAYGKQTQTGLMMGLEYATGGTMTVGRRSSSSSRRTTRASPTWARTCSPRPTATTRPTSPSGHVVRRRPGAAAGRRGIQEGAAGRARRRRFDHRRQVEPLRLPHRPQLAGRHLERRRARPRRTSIATLAQDYAFGRDGVKAFKDSVKRRRSSTRNTCRRPPPTSPPAPSA